MLLSMRQKVRRSKCISVEYVGDLLRSDTGAVVNHRYFSILVHSLDMHFDLLTFWRILNSIVYQVCQYLFNTFRVGIYLQFHITRYFDITWPYDADMVAAIIHYF